MPRRLPVWTTLVAAATAAAGWAGCLHVRYLTQAARGQLDLMDRARPIEQVVSSEAAPPKLRALLLEVDEIRRYGENHGLTPADSYHHYVELEREVAVWVVTACEPLRFEPKTWWFPVVGSFAYLGWFNRDDADTFASRLAQGGLDVSVRGATAFSTLGWFDDPVLSTMISSRASYLGDFVNVVLHESAHATLHLSGQSYFNESLASFVGDGLTNAYLRDKHGEDSAAYQAYVAAERRRQKRRPLLAQAYERLAALYASSLPAADKLAEKQRVFSRLRLDLAGAASAKKSDSAEAVNTRKPSPLNNATLVNVRVYSAARDALASLWRACGEDWGRFLSAAATIDEDSFTKDQQEDLEAVIATAVGCP